MVSSWKHVSPHTGGSFYKENTEDVWINSVIIDQSFPLILVGTIIHTMTPDHRETGFKSFSYHIWTGEDWFPVICPISLWNLKLMVIIVWTLQSVVEMWKCWTHSVKLRPGYGHVTIVLRVVAAACKSLLCQEDQVVLWQATTTVHFRLVLHIEGLTQLGPQYLVRHNKWYPALTRK